MKRWLLLIPLALALSAPFAGSSPLEPRPPLKLEIPAYGSHFLPALYAGNQRALVIASGSGATALGVYVYDSDGNCVARDEAFQYATRDDLAAEWFPREDAPYVVEVRNAGMNLNPVNVVLR